jgi:hypothetical protein
MPDGTDGSDGVERTTAHTLLRSVIEEHGGCPAHTPQSEGEGDRGPLRIGFRDDEDLKQLSWEEFFDEFDEKDLVGVYSAATPASRATDRPYCGSESTSKPRRESDAPQPHARTQGWGRRRQSGGSTPIHHTRKAYRG